MNPAHVEIAREAVRTVRARMDPEEYHRVRNVKITAKGRPSAEDLERGCSRDQKASYFGVPCELGVQGSQELPSPEEATGEITLFLENLAPITPERLFIAIAHEYMHALGHDEETIQAMGLWLEDGPPCTPS